MGLPSATLCLPGRSLNYDKICAKKRMQIKSIPSYLGIEVQDIGWGKKQILASQLCLATDVILPLQYFRLCSIVFAHSTKIFSENSACGLLWCLILRKFIILVISGAPLFTLSSHFADSNKHPINKSTLTQKTSPRGILVCLGIRCYYGNNINP